MTKSAKSPITTHILDINRGKPAVGVPVVLEQSAQGWKEIAKGVTDADGRVGNLLPPGSPIAEGTYRLTFETSAYFQKLGVRGFYPYVTIVFEIAEASEHYHVPLLLSAHGYSTYRGS